MNAIAQKFAQADEPYARGYYEWEGEDSFARHAHAYAAWLKEVPPPAYDGGNFYPCGALTDKAYGVVPHYNCSFFVDEERIRQKDASLLPLLSDEYSRNPYGNIVHTVAGFCYTHSLPHYGRVAAEGLRSYRERIENKNGKLRRGLSDLLDGIEAYRAHCEEYLKENGGKRQLIEALNRVPFLPAENVYQALVCWNFIYHLDGCDNVGRLDQDLEPFWRGENIEPLLREFFRIVDRSNGFSASVGPRYNEITLQCLKAIKGLRRPQIELRVTEDMPQKYWDAAVESLAQGGTNPSLYNEAAYMRAFRKAMPEIPEQDLSRFCGVGCTESSLAGISRAGSLDAGIHLPYIFAGCMKNDLPQCGDFAEFYGRFLRRYREELRATLEAVYQTYRLREKFRPAPFRTLVVDDCIEKDADFNAGGARYNWGVINFAGIVNVVEDMLAVKELVFDEHRYSAEEFAAGMERQDENLFDACKKCGHFGVNNADCDAFARKFSEDIVSELKKYRNYFGGRYLAASIQFDTCARAGEIVPATPDGRRNGMPLADSLAAIHGNDTQGITAMLNSVACIAQEDMPGTPVVNLRLGKDFLRKHLRAVALGYFAQGGMQLQISCLSKEDMLDAMEHPQAHANLIVRVGGYSEYFIRLSKELQRQIVQRTEYV